MNIYELFHILRNCQIHIFVQFSRVDLPLYLPKTHRSTLMDSVSQLEVDIMKQVLFHSSSILIFGDKWSKTKFT